MKKKYLDAIVDVALTLGVIILASNNTEGWGWLVFILFVRNT